jgi:hypothetical protein
LATNVPARLKAHNAGQNPSTARWKPWIIDVCIEFRTEQMAVRFEKYLKSGSGHTFANRHFCDLQIGDLCESLNSELNGENDAT